jgi:hypothetical protein
MAFPEPDLQDAAANCYIDLLPTSLATDPTKSTKETTLAFCALLKDTFPPDQEGGFPCANLLAVLGAQAADMVDVTASGPFGQTVTFPPDLSAIVFTLYKLLWITEVLSDPGFGQDQISTAQATAVLAAYNTAFDI